MLLSGRPLRGYYGLIANYGDNTVTPLDLRNPLAPVAHPPVGLGALQSHAFGIAISPDGMFALVTNQGSGTVTPLDL